MTDPRIEAAARALFLAHPLSNKEVVDACWDLYENEARAALAAADEVSVIVTREQLDALPGSAMIVDRDQIVRSMWQTPDAIRHRLLPARVIHWGTE